MNATSGTSGQEHGDDDERDEEAEEEESTKKCIEITGRLEQVQEGDTLTVRAEAENETVHVIHETSPLPSYRTLSTFKPRDCKAQTVT